MDPLQQTLEYQRRTEHHYARYARSLGYMDWERQPNPFRVYEGAPQVPLELAPLEPGVSFAGGVREGGVEPAAFDLRGVSQLFQDSLGLSAWKRSGHARWALRMNPSSGNLHPTEGYLVGGPIPGVTEHAGVWHYQPLLHALEARARLADEYAAALAAALPANTALVALSSIFVRESWKYGERAFRYCQHDAGHAIAAVGYAAAALGWSCRLLERPNDFELAELLGVARQDGPEAEHPDALLLVGHPGSWERSELPRSFSLPDPPVADAAGWRGAPNELAVEHHEWPVIEAVHRATEKSGAPPASFWRPVPPPEPATARVEAEAADLRQVIHQRRSAVAMDGQTTLPREAFFRLLEGLVAGTGCVPYASLPWRPRVHLALFVHRVADLTPGQYALVRDPAALDALRSSLRDDFAWTRPEGCPAELPLYLLKEGDSRALAAGLSCGQEIGSHGVFACAMLAEFEEALRELGPWFYRRLHWEAGAIGQALYLGAEAAGIRGTGIGCFFDQETEHALGLEGERFRDLYHFTIGGPVEDSRIETLPPYGHLERFRG